MPVPDDASPAQRQAWYDQFLKCVEREEQLVHYRISWGLQCNVAAFASLFALGQLPNAATWLSPIASIPIAIFGFFVTLQMKRGVAAAHSQIDRLIRELKQRLKITGNQDWQNSEFIRPFGNEEYAHPQGKAVAQSLPTFFMLVWVLVGALYVAQSGLVLLGQDGVMAGTTLPAPMTTQP